MSFFFACSKAFIIMIFHVNKKRSTQKCLMTRDIQNSSKKWKKRYDKHLQNGITKIRNAKNTRRNLRSCQKKNFESSIIQNTLEIPNIFNKNVINITKSIGNNLPKRMMCYSIRTFNQNKVANKFNRFYTDISSKLSSSISKTQKISKCCHYSKQNSSRKSSPK